MQKNFFIMIALAIFSILPVFGFDESDIERLENIQYGRNFPNESFSQRLNRLENDMLGMAQSGDVDTRIGKLYALRAGRTRIPAVQNNYYDENGKKKNALKRIFDNFFDFGSMTGFTPAWEDFDSLDGYSYSSFNNVPQYGQNGIFTQNNSCGYSGDNYYSHYNGLNNYGRFGTPYNPGWGGGYYSRNTYGGAYSHNRYGYPAAGYGSGYGRTRKLPSFGSGVHILND